MVCCGGRKTREPGEKSTGQGREPTTNSTTQVSTRATAVGGERSYHCSRLVTCVCFISHWLLVIFIFVLIGRCDCFGFGFTTLNKKALYALLLASIQPIRCKVSAT